MPTPSPVSAFYHDMLLTEHYAIVPDVSLRYVSLPKRKERRRVAQVHQVGRVAAGVGRGRGGVELLLQPAVRGVAQGGGGAGGDGLGGVPEVSSSSNILCSRVNCGGIKNGIRKITLPS